eukprot:95389-Prymnesium_polylepis.1
MQGLCSYYDNEIILDQYDACDTVPFEATVAFETVDSDEWNDEKDKNDLNENEICDAIHPTGPKGRFKRKNQAVAETNKRQCLLSEWAK